MTPLDGWGGFDLPSGWLEGVEKNEESIICPDFVPTFGFFVDRVVAKDECLYVWEFEYEGDSFRFNGRACWDSDAGGGEVVLVTCEEEGGGISSISGSKSSTGVGGVFTGASDC
jgi:hypothetical protein